MMKQHLVIACIAQAGIGWSQATFMSVLNGAGTARGDLHELSSGNLFTGIAYQSGVSLIGSNGMLLHSSHVKIDTLLALRSVKKLADNSFIFTATYRKDTCAATGSSRTYPALGKMDSLGNVTSALYYRLNAPECSNQAGDLEVLSDGSSVVMGRDKRLYLLKAGPDLAPIWAKRFTEIGGFRFVKELPGGDLLAGINLHGSGAVVARLNMNGEFVWCKSYIRPGGMVQDAVIESDDAFIITGLTDSTGSTNGFVPLPPSYHPKLYMLKINGAGEVQWCRGYDSAPNNWYDRGAVKITRTLDGNYAVLANLGIPGYNLWHRPFLMKTNTNGDTLWARSLGSDGYAYETVNLLQYSDGALLFYCRIWGTMPDGTQNNWALLCKTDSLGHLPCHERHHPIVVTDLFPTDSSFTLTSIDGAVAYPAFVQDTIYPPITVHDGCSSFTDVPAVVRAQQRIRIRPNPNTGRFTLEVRDPLMAESYYSVYDPLGKLLYQRPLPAGATVEEIDLSRFGPGTYVLRLTDPEGSRHERVVVE